LTQAEIILKIAAHVDGLTFHDMQRAPSRAQSVCHRIEIGR